MLTNSRIAYHRHDHKRCINAALCRARELCDARKARLTPIRETVLKTIWASHRPLGAYEIVDQMSQSETSAHRVLPPTVYRAIQFLLDQGLIHRLSSLNAYIGCPFPVITTVIFFSSVSNAVQRQNAATTRWIMPS